MVRFRLASKLFISHVKAIQACVELPTAADRKNIDDLRQTVKAESCCV